jgi:hypothetical protein
MLLVFGLDVGETDMTIVLRQEVWTARGFLSNAEDLSYAEESGLGRLNNEGVWAFFAFGLLSSRAHAPKAL